MTLHLLIEEINKQQLKKDLPKLHSGDTLSVLIKEGHKQRVQMYRGTLISQNIKGKNSTLTIRRVFQGIGIERVFLLHSPSIESIEVTRSIKSNRSKLYYLRHRKGKARRLSKRYAK